MNNRVVVTGIGILSSIGNNCKDVLNSLIKIKSGIKFSNYFKNNGLKSNVYAPIKYNINNIRKSKFFKFANNSTIYSYLSLKQTIYDSKLKNYHISNNMTGLIIGNGCCNNIDENFKDTNLYNLIKNMPSNVSAFLSELFKIKGISYSISSACSTSSHCIGNAFEIIKNGIQNIIFCGGSDEITINTAYQFDSFKLLSRNFNNFPKISSRPYDKFRDGFVLSEGGGIIVLEELNHAIYRKAKIYAELVSYGFSSNSLNIVSPLIEGEYNCMVNSLKKCNNLNIDYINSHATSTIKGDKVELLAIKKVFNKNNIPIISSTKSITGHSLGASGVHSIIYTLLMMKFNFLFPNINIKNVSTLEKKMNIIISDSCILNYKFNIFMINNFGFGGSNVTLIFKRFNYF